MKRSKVKDEQIKWPAAASGRHAAAQASLRTPAPGIPLSVCSGYPAKNAERPSCRWAPSGSQFLICE